MLLRVNQRDILVVIPSAKSHIKDLLVHFEPSLVSLRQKQTDVISLYRSNRSSSDHL